MAYHNRGRRQYTLGWSNTRITVLEYCQKKYFFNYYTHTLRRIDEKMRLDGLLLKHLKSMEMWMGEKTHHILSDYLKLLREGNPAKDGAGIQDDTVQNLKDEMEDIMTKEFEMSKNKDYEAGYDRDNKFGLSEHYYGQDVDDRLDEIIGRVTGNLDAFIESEWNDKVQRYFEIAKSVFVESPKIPNFDSMRVNLRHVPELADISIMASPDFGVIFDDNNYLILDWKSGKQSFDSEGLSDQLKIYVLKVLLKKGNTKLGDLSIKAHEVYLPSMNMIGGEVAQEDLDDVVEKIIQDVEFQKQFIVDQDVVQNNPLPHKSFQRTTSAKKCDKCTFRKICDQLKEIEE